MDGQMDRWTDGHMDRWIDGRTDIWIDVWMDERLSECFPKLGLAYGAFQ